jgi:hypothetical protein
MTCIQGKRFKLLRFCSDIPVEWDDDDGSNTEVIVDDEDDDNADKSMLQNIFNGLHNARGSATGSSSKNGIPVSIVRFMG